MIGKSQIDFLQGQEIFLFFTASRPILETADSYAMRSVGLSAGGEAITQVVPSAAEVKNA
jgi:hypothetical protein